MEIVQIHIPKPCKQDWNSMQPTSCGRFCTVCNLEVIDFTQKSVDEIQEYFQSIQYRRVCGHYKQSQVTISLSKTQQVIMKTYSKMDATLQGKVSRMVVLGAITMAMFLTSCNCQRDQTLTGDTVLIPEKVVVPDSLKNSNTENETKDTTSKETETTKQEETKKKE